MKIITVFPLFLVLACASTPRLQADLNSFDAKVLEMNQSFDKIPANPKDKEWIKTKLQHMVDVDQYMRKYWNITFSNKYSEAEEKEFKLKFVERNNKIDAEDTRDLKELLKTYHWFSISEFGTQADKNAWLLVQHADLDPEFQKQVLTILTELLPKHETDPSNYAYLYDRVASSFSDPNKRRAQKYGTQGQCTGPGQWKPWPIENPEQLNERRKSVSLGTEEDYFKMFKDICH